MTTTPEVRKATRREWVGLAVLALACLLYVMDLMGSIGVASYRAGIDAGVPGAPEAARDTLGWAVAVAGQVPGGAELLSVAQQAFVAGLQLTSLVAAGIAAAIAVVAAVALREPAPAELPAEAHVCPA